MGHPRLDRIFSGYTPSGQSVTPPPIFTEQLSERTVEESNEYAQLVVLSSRLGSLIRTGDAEKIMREGPQLASQISRSSLPQDLITQTVSRYVGDLDRLKSRAQAGKSSTSGTARQTGASIAVAQVMDDMSYLMGSMPNYWDMCYGSEKEFMYEDYTPDSVKRFRKAREKFRERLKNRFSKFKKDTSAKIKPQNKNEVLSDIELEKARAKQQELEARRQAQKHRNSAAQYPVGSDEHNKHIEAANQCEQDAEVASQCCHECEHLEGQVHNCTHDHGTDHTHGEHNHTDGQHSHEQGGASVANNQVVVDQPETVVVAPTEIQVAYAPPSSPKLKLSAPVVDGSEADKHYESVVAGGMLATLHNAEEHQSQNPVQNDKVQSTR